MSAAMLRRPAQELADQFTCLDGGHVDASPVTYVRSPGDWCQYPHGCSRPAELSVSDRDPCTGRWSGPSEYCARHGLVTVRWLLLDELRLLLDGPSIGVEVWQTRRTG
jgi:hypothetical protein